jgi:hypothetical protein
MKKRILVPGLVFCLFHSVLMSQKKEALIFPDPTQKICLVKSTGKMEPYLSGEKLPSNSLMYKMIMNELSLPFHQSLIKLNQCSRNFSSNTEGPNVLFLSQTEGGFPRQGLVLHEEGKANEYPDLNFVDLVLDEQRISRGELDIFSHELGHVMMLNIWKNIPDQRSNKQHVSMGISDYTTAIFEGWGIHFQRLTHDHIPLYREKYLNSFDYSRSTSRLWHSNIDQALRIDGVLDNIYIHQKLIPELDTSHLSHEEIILLEHASPIFDKTRLRNGQQMLSCEGVLATLFYRINTNETLQNSYRDNEFYNHFLIIPIPTQLKPQQIFNPFENVMLKHFWIWSKLDKKVTSESILFLEYIQGWLESFPEDENEIIKLFLLTTAGKTVSNELGNVYEELGFYGMIGNIQKFREYFKEYQKVFTTLEQRVLKEKSSLGENVGPQLWIENKSLLVRRALWDPSRKRPLWINLNTASAYDLASFPEISMKKAHNLIQLRNDLGFFKSIQEAKDHGWR